MRLNHLEKDSEQLAILKGYPQLDHRCFLRYVKVIHLSPIQSDHLKLMILSLLMNIHFVTTAIFRNMDCNMFIKLYAEFLNLLSGLFRFRSFATFTINKHLSQVVFHIPFFINITHWKSDTFSEFIFLTHAIFMQIARQPW